MIEPEQDERGGVVDLVRDAGRERAQRREPIGLHEAGARRVLGADVGEHALDGDDLAALGEQRVDGAARGDLVACRAAIRRASYGARAGAGAGARDRGVEGRDALGIGVRGAEEAGRAQRLGGGHAEEALGVAVQVDELDASPDRGGR